MDIPHHNLELYAYLNDMLSRWFFHLINQEVELLDFGCGDGFLTNCIQKSFYKAHVLGVDTDPLHVQKARECYPTGKFMNLEAGGSIALEDDFFHLIYTVNVFHHIDPCQRAHYAQELIRILKPKGTLVIFESNPYNWRSRKQFYAEHDTKVRMLSLSMMKTLFTMESCFTKGIYLYPTISSWYQQFLAPFPYGPLYALMVSKS